MVRRLKQEYTRQIWFLYPITLAILESLKELRGINKNKIKKWEQEQKDK
jgi:hypothetical protein